jgi:hypothetical protein
VHLASRRLRLTDLPQSLWEGLFDTRGYVARYAGSLRRAEGAVPISAEELLADLGEQVLGAELMEVLAKGRRQRTLLVRLPGEDLVDLFVQAGGFIPHLVFLSACHSGALLHVRDWQDLWAVLKGTGEGQREGEGRPPPVDELVKADAGYTGTALALARHDLAQSSLPGGGYAAVDPANPLVLGAQRLRATPHPGCSADLDALYPPQVLPGRQDLEPREGSMGRGGELSDLNRRWLAERPGPAHPVAVLQGLAGLGKTALAAEAVHLWRTRFEHVVAMQARPQPITAEAFYRQVDDTLALASQAYREACRRDPNTAVHLPASEGLTGERRLAVLCYNLLQALRREAVLLVLDNFETHLAERWPTRPATPAATPSGSASWRCWRGTWQGAAPGSCSPPATAPPHWPPRPFGSPWAPFPWARPPCSCAAARPCAACWMQARKARRGSSGSCPSAAATR